MKLLFSCLSKWAKTGFRVILKDLEKSFWKVCFLLYKTNRFPCATCLFLPHFDVICDLSLSRRTAYWNLFNKLVCVCSLRLFTNRSQMTSKCVKNKKVAHEAIAFLFFSCFSYLFNDMTRRDVFVLYLPAVTSHLNRLRWVTKNCDCFRKIMLRIRLNRASVVWKILSKFSKLSANSKHRGKKIVMMASIVRLSSNIS